MLCQKTEDSSHDHHLNCSQGSGFGVGNEKLGYLSEGASQSRGLLFGHGFDFEEELNEVDGGVGFVSVGGDTEDIIGAELIAGEGVYILAGGSTPSIIDAILYVIEGHHKFVHCLERLFILLFQFYTKWYYGFYYVQFTVGFIKIWLVAV